MLQGGSGPDKLSCFHPDYFSFKPSASVELIMRMVSLAVPPSLAWLVSLLPWCSTQNPVCCCVPGRASSGVTAGGTTSWREEQQHPAIPHQHPLSKRDKPSGGGGRRPDFHGYQAKNTNRRGGSSLVQNSLTPHIGTQGQRVSGGRAGGQAGDMCHLHPTVRSGPSCPTWSPKACWEMGQIFLRQFLPRNEESVYRSLRISNQQ